MKVIVLLYPGSTVTCRDNMWANCVMSCQLKRIMNNKVKKSENIMSNCVYLLIAEHRALCHLQTLWYASFRGPLFTKKHRLTGKWIPIINLSWFNDSLRFIMELPMYVLDPWTMPCVRTHTFQWLIMAVSFQQPNPYKHMLRCQYRRSHPFYLLRPLKEEVLYHAPFIALYHDIITDTEINTTKTLAKSQVMKSCICRTKIP